MRRILIGASSEGPVGIVLKIQCLKCLCSNSCKDLARYLTEEAYVSATDIFKEHKLHIGEYRKAYNQKMDISKSMGVCVGVS